MTRDDQTSIPAAFVRGGSSKALFFHEHSIPPPGPLRDRVLKRVMGTPDPIQIDGMGGTKAVTSKIAVLQPSSRPGVDVDYTFIQVGVKDDAIGYQANCGNISAGVGPFGIDEDLIKHFRKGRSIDPKYETQEVSIYNTNTNKVLIAHVPIDSSGRSVAKGDFAIAAVPGSGAPILLDYRETAGASQNKGLLPTGNACDMIAIEGRSVKITICDIANILVLANAKDFDVTGHESAASLTENPELIGRVKELRGKAAQLVGMCHDWQKVDKQSPFMPMPVLIAPPEPGLDIPGHLSARLFLDNMCHESMAGTGSVCLAAASRIPGSVVYDQIGEIASQEDALNISHPLGIMPVAVVVSEESRGTLNPRFNTLSFIRTSRRLMDGHVYIPKEVWDPEIEQTHSSKGDRQHQNAVNGVGSARD